MFAVRTVVTLKEKSIKCNSYQHWQSPNTKFLISQAGRDDFMGSSFGFPFGQIWYRWGEKGAQDQMSLNEQDWMDLLSSPRPEGG